MKKHRLASSDYVAIESVMMDDFEAAEQGWHCSSKQFATALAVLSRAFHL